MSIKKMYYTYAHSWENTKKNDLKLDYLLLKEVSIKIIFNYLEYIQITTGLSVKKSKEPAVVAHVFNPSTREAEAGGSL